MIHFLRKFRFKLLAENKINRVILYATGEIILVVIGILIALSINNWNTEKMDRILETDYLKRLTNDLAIDTSNYSWTMRTTQRKQEALGTLLDILNNHQLRSIDSTALLKEVFLGRMLSFAHPKVTTGTFDELKNTGSFSKITSTTLRSEISNYYFNRDHQYQRIEQKRLDPGLGDIIDQFIPGIQRLDNDFIYRTDLVSISEILDHITTPSFKKAVVGEYNLAVFMHGIQEHGLEVSTDLLNKIKAELKNH